MNSLAIEKALKALDPKNAACVPIQNKPVDPAPVSVSAAENLSFIADQRQARINAMTDELVQRRQFIDAVNRSGNFNQYVAETVKMEGHIEGLQESLLLHPSPKPPTTSTESEA